MHEYPRDFYALGTDSLIPMIPPSVSKSATESMHTLRSLEQRLALEPSLPIGTLIFHCSRCGSTLLARLFGLDPANRVFAEPEALPKFLMANAKELSNGNNHLGLRTFVQAFGLAPRAGEKRVIIKLNSQALPYIEAFRACFPDVPFIYLLRDPEDVTASLLANPPTSLGYAKRQKIAATWSKSGQETEPYTPAEWFAWYTDKNLRLALHHASQFSDIIDYRNFIPRYLELVNSISGCQLSAELPEVVTTLSRHSKRPKTAYLKSTESGTNLSEITGRIAGEVYRLWGLKLNERETYPPP